MHRHASVAVLLLFACSGSTMTEDPGGGGDDMELPTTGTYYRYVLDDLVLPGNGVTADELAFDVDGKGDATDNALGSIISILAGIDVQLQPQVDSAITGGDLVSLHEMRADDISSDESVSWEVYLGQPMSESPKFDGTDAFTLNSAVSTEPLVGRIGGGTYTGGPGEVAISLTVGSQTIDVTLRGARVRASITGDGVEGKLGGALSLEEINNEILPAVAGFVDDAVQNDCTAGTGCSCESGSVGGTLQEFFDADGDCSISATEIKDHDLVKAAMRPDVDLLGDDGTADSMSFGVGFHGVRAEFNSPNN